MRVILERPIVRAMAIFVLTTGLYAVALQIVQYLWPGEIGNAGPGAAMGAVFGYLEFRRANLQQRPNNGLQGMEDRS